ncbi:zinc metallochaperone AztD [Microlunatus parietis]|uniref:DNA-binding beta-propeller fold protein YncE n=1 Tax=Microlunatus parietis TaxID=682979 RepID=A0A7Y9ID31_9ACTN|nr:zinc metallochaperone AztD [Microlunatus parietis]NYE74574.1 DNA-binding beta-propeller fold protein YncE [Microlunatus parietis]
MRKVRATLTAALAATLLAVAGCATPSEPAAPSGAGTERPEVTGPRISVSYNGGILVLDRDTLEPVADLKLPGFLRLNPAGDRRHLLVSTPDGFRVLDTGVEVKGHGDHDHFFAGEATLTDITYPAPEPGHVVRHAAKVALFSDGAGTVQVLDPAKITTPPGEPTWTAPAPHHGVAVPLPDGGLFVSVGTEEGRTGAQVLDSSLKEVATSDDCPDLHGEATAANGTVLAGCTDGVLLWKDGKFVKIDSPDEYGRIGNQAGSHRSDVVLGDYKTDPDAELEEPTRISLIDTETGKLRLVELGTSYTFRSLGRGPNGEALVLGTDGRLHVIDPDTGKITKQIKIIEPWREPVDWQDPRPTLLVEDDTAWVTDPATSTVHVIYLPGNKVVDSVELPQVPNEISGVGDRGH